MDGANPHTFGKLQRDAPRLFALHVSHLRRRRRLPHAQLWDVTAHHHRLAEVRLRVDAESHGHSVERHRGFFASSSQSRPSGSFRAPRAFANHYKPKPKSKPKARLALTLSSCRFQAAHPRQRQKPRAHKPPRVYIVYLCAACASLE